MIVASIMMWGRLSSLLFSCFQIDGRLESLPHMFRPLHWLVDMTLGWADVAVVGWVDGAQRAHIGYLFGDMG